MAEKTSSLHTDLVSVSKVRREPAEAKEKWTRRKWDQKKNGQLNGAITGGLKNWSLINSTNQAWSTKNKALRNSLEASSVSSRTTDSKKKIIQDVYILLPFEIGRRLVRDDAVEQAIETKQSLDKISTTITTIDDCEITGRRKVKFWTPLSSEWEISLLHR